MIISILNYIFYTSRCLHYFSSEEKLRAHGEDCEMINECRIILPTEKEKVFYFKKYNALEQLPFVVYADLECILEKQEHTNGKFQALQEHTVFSIGYYIHCKYKKSLCKYRAYRGDSGAVAWFVRELVDIVRYLMNNDFKYNVPMEEKSTDEWNVIWKMSTHCSICEKPFSPDDNERDRDHCHYTGRFRGMSHHECNLKFNRKYIVPVVFHNLSGYDAHFIIEEIATSMSGETCVLPLTKEKYVSFTQYIPFDDKKRFLQLRFIDSFKFLASSLDNLSSILDNSNKNILRENFQNLTNTQFQLLTQKGVFPYEYLDTYSKLDETALPSRDLFYSSINNETVSIENYNHAHYVWQNFNIQNLGEYSDLYMKTDILLLADIFENFREKSVQCYRLDPAYSYTLPNYAWEVMLLYTDIHMELLTDIDMLMFIERGIRGGIAQCITRYARANNKYMQSDYDPNMTTNYLMYFDVNNLYGFAMSQPLPYGQFKWVDDVESFDISSIKADSDIGYIFEVDLSYPQDLHDLHSDLPFCPTHDKATNSKQTKLLTTLHNKTRYIIHYQNLQQCIKYGLHVTKIHRILQFAQSTWLKPYIDLNTMLRQQATNDFDKTLYKLMNNAVFGKTMENLRNHVDVKLRTKWRGRYGIEQYIAKPNFHSRSIFSENFVAIQLNKLHIKYNKPVYIGMCILEISKICMYDFHYGYMLPQYRDQCKILYMDTDSFMYNIQCNDIYEDMKSHISMFDTSDYDSDNVYNMARNNKKVPGLMKDENCGKIMREYVGLRAKMYSLKVDNSKDTKKIKGIKKNIVQKTIHFEDYKICLNEKIEIKRQQVLIRSRLHKVYTISEKKIALSCFDDKRYILDDGINTLAWGHYRIVNNNDV